MQHQISEFLAHIFVIFLEDGIGQLKSFLHCQVAQRVKRLLTIPWTFFAQFIHDFEQMPEASESFCVFVGGVHNYDYDYNYDYNYNFFSPG